MCFWGYGPSLWFLGHRPSTYTCLVYFSVSICPKRICGMIFMIMSPVGGSRTMCILLLYTMSIYKGKQFVKQNPGHQMSHKEDRDWTIFAHAGLNAIRNPSSTVSFKVRSSSMNKQTNKQIKTTTTTTILTHLPKRKVSSWRNFQPEGIMTLNFPGRTPLSILRTANTSSKKSLSPQQYMWSSTQSITVISLGSI